jgi:hypothetical protein
MGAFPYRCLPFWLLFACVFARPGFADPMTVVSVRTVASTDDAEQTSGGSVNTGSSDLDIGTTSWSGMRFRSIAIPRNATITKASLTFKAAGSNSSPSSTTFYGQAISSASAFSSSSYNLSSRSRTSASVSWSPIASWSNNVSYTTPDISPLIQEIVDRSDWSSGNHLVLLCNNPLTGQRSAETYDGEPSSAPLLHVEYTPFVRPVAPNLLLVLTSSSSPTTQELKREEWLKWWAYKVTRIAATTSQASFDAAAAVNDVAFVSETITSADLNTKLKNAALGVVTDEPALLDDFALSTTLGNTGASTFSLASNTHYITSPFSPGSLTLFTSPPPSMELAGTLAQEASVLGSFSSSAQGLITIEAGGILADSTRAAGRRVFVPWSAGSDYNLIGSNGQMLLRRSLEWAAGLQSWWKLDETSGSTAVDSGAHARSGVLNGTTFAAGTTPAKLATGLNLDGVSTYVSVPNHSTLQLRNALSVSGWIYLNSFGAGSDVDTVLRKGDAAPAAYQLCIMDGKVTLHLNEIDGTALGTFGSTTLTPGKWHHVAATWDGTTAYVYLDGYADSAGRAVSGMLPMDTRSLFIGGRIDGTDLVSGKIDDVRLYNYALTAAEIFNLGRINQPRGIRIIKWVESQ